MYSRSLNNVASFQVGCSNVHKMLQEFHLYPMAKLVLLHIILCKLQNLLTTFSEGLMCMGNVCLLHHLSFTYHLFAIYLSMYHLSITIVIFFVENTNTTPPTPPPSPGRISCSGR